MAENLVGIALRGAADAVAVTTLFASRGVH
jgi:hypothetical protein